MDVQGPGSDERRLAAATARIGVAEADLYSVRLGDAGVKFRFQPELVINALKVAGGAL